MQAILQISSHLTLTVTLCKRNAIALNLQIRKLGLGNQFTRGHTDGECRAGF